MPKGGPISTSKERRRAQVNAHKSTKAGSIMRDLLVWELHLQGMQNKAIAAQDGRGEDTIADVIARFERNGLSHEDLLAKTPAQILNGLLRRSQMAWRIAADVAVNSHGNVRIGAVKSMMDADARVLHIMQSTGYLPKELGTMHHMVDIKAIAITMIDAVRALESGEKTPAQVRHTFEQLLQEVQSEEPSDTPLLGTPIDAVAEDA